MELKEREQVVKDLQEIVDNYSGSWKRFNVLDGALSLIKELTEKNSNLDDTIACLEIELEIVKADTVQKMQEKIKSKSEYGTINISSWQLEQIAKEVLEENK
jgi:tellurite resistance-related uncharacterized protein